MKVSKTTPPPIPQPSTFQLTLSEEEAQVLLSLSGSVTGCPNTTYRGITDAIYYALQNAGVESGYKFEGRLEAKTDPEKTQPTPGFAYAGFGFGSALPL